MRFERVLLVNPNYGGSHYSRWGAFPTGLGYIAEILEQKGIDYDVLDMVLGYDFKDLKNKLRIYKPDLICIGIMTYKYKQHYDFIREIKRFFPSIKIVVGGQHASTFRDLVMKECEAIDYLVILDGENTIVELCEGKHLDKILGLIYRKDGEIKFTGERPFIKNLDEIPFPKYKKFEIERYDKYINIVSTRGCPNLCTFCPVKLTAGNVYRIRSAQNVIKEILYWYGREIRAFGFIDDNFTLDKRRVYEICDLIEKNNFKGVKFECPNGIRADNVDYDLLKRMKEVNFSDVGFGVESADPQVLINIKKGETIETIDRAVRWSVKLGFDVSLYFIIGNPGDTMGTIKKTFEFALKYPVKGVAFYSVMPYPGTELYIWMKKNAKVVLDYEDYFNKKQEHWSNIPVFETAEFTIRERKKAFKKSRNVMRKVQRRYYFEKLGNRLGKKIGIYFLFFKPVYRIRNSQKLLDMIFRVRKKLNLV